MLKDLQKLNYKKGTSFKFKQVQFFAYRPADF